MSLKEVNISTNFIAPKTMKKGDDFLGYFVRSKASTKYPENPAHYLEGKDGLIFAINGTAHLNLLMKEVLPGALTKITYDGTIKSKNGKDAHQFKVAFDAEDKKVFASTVVADTDFAPVASPDSFNSQKVS